MIAVDHLASIVTLIGFPLVLIGLADLYRERKLSMWKARKWVGIIFLLLGLAAWGADVADRFGILALSTWGLPTSTGAIVWNFEDAARGRGYFLDMQKPANGGEVIVAGFGAHAKNTTPEPINDFEAFLRSDKNNKSIPI